MDYRQAGVDVAKGDRFVDLIKPWVKETQTEDVRSAIGGYASLYEIDQDRLLAASTDGVGTKVKLAMQYSEHESVGQDLVGMCVNDLYCVGARPLFFLDYLATGKLDLDIHTKVVKGIASACKQVGCALVGGETAEMPGVYDESSYDLAGFVVGEVRKSELITGERINVGDHVIGFASSGFHSNGYSLVRKLLKEGETDLAKACLAPTKLYHAETRLLMELGKELKGMVHVTGGGVQNFLRLKDGIGFDFSKWPRVSDQLPHVKEICERSGASERSLYETFNMGIGFAAIVSAGTNVPGAVQIGVVTDQDGEIQI